MSVADQGHVADICAFVNFHGFTPPAGWKRDRLGHNHASVLGRLLKIGLAEDRQ